MNDIFVNFFLFHRPAASDPKTGLVSLVIFLIYLSIVNIFFEFTTEYSSVYKQVTFVWYSRGRNQARAS